MDTAATSTAKTVQVEFSPALGGPLFQLYRRTHLSGDALDFLRRRVVVVSMIAWLPLLILVLAEQHLTGAVPFWRDVDLHVRLLITLPLLIFAEPFAHSRIAPLVELFIDRQIVCQEDVPHFRKAVDSAKSARDSVVLELSVLFLVYTLGIWLWRSQMAMSHSGWYAITTGAQVRLTAAGYWLTFVSVPLVQFLLLRWYVRICIWCWLLWRISRLTLHLIATHPDRAGGIGFLGAATFAFTPFLFAQGSLVSGAIANRVLFGGESLMNYKADALILVAALVLFILGPSLFFVPRLDAAKRHGKFEYGLLGSRYVLGFESRWIRGERAHSRELLGTSDIQSLADLSNSYAVVHEMRPIPFWIDDVLRLVVATAAPLVPLGLLVMPVDELITRILRLLFQG